MEKMTSVELICDPAIKGNKGYENSMVKSTFFLKFVCPTCSRGGREKVWMSGKGLAILNF